MKTLSLNSKSIGKKEIHKEILVIDKPRPKLASQIKIKNVAPPNIPSAQNQHEYSESKDLSHKSRIGIE